jgi:hypothetical protein
MIQKTTKAVEDFCVCSSQATFPTGHVGYDSEHQFLAFGAAHNLWVSSLNKLSYPQELS